MTAGPTLAQRRARHAWTGVEDAKRMLRNGADKDYAREAKRLPVRIVTSGLGQALAFLNAKGGGGRELLAKHLAQWLLVERRLAKGAAPVDVDGKALCRAIIEGDSDLLRRATGEAQSWLQWLTRFAEAEIGVEED